MRQDCRTLFWYSGCRRAVYPCVHNTANKSSESRLLRGAVCSYKRRTVFQPVTPLPRTMDVAHLPSEIFAAICDLIPSHDLAKIMLVNKHCRQFAERILYSSIHLDFFENRNRLQSIQCLQTLSVSKSAAVALRQLSVHGLALTNPAVYTLLTTALHLAVNLSSLDIVFLATLDSPPFPEALARSPQFLPQLSAINTDEPQAVVQLAPGRPCASVRVQETIGEDILGHLIDALSRAAPAKQLQLKVATPGPEAIVSSVRRIARSFDSLTTLGIQFVLPSPTLTWEALAVSA